MKFTVSTALLLSLTNTVSAVSYYLSIAGPSGQLFTTNGGPANSVGIESFQFGASQVIDAATGAGGGKASLSTVAISRKADAQSPALWKALLSGTTLSSVIVTETMSTAINPNGASNKYLLTNAKVSSLQHMGSDGDPMTENIEFTFAAIAFAWNDGTKTTTSTYNRVNNVVSA